MRVVLPGGATVELGSTETTPTVGITDYSRRVTDDFGITTVVERGFSRRMSVRLAVPFESIDGIQRDLAALRATSAQWIADDRFACLMVTGFFRDFSLDLAAGPIGYCTLSVEGLTQSETFADPGGDIGPAGQVSTLQLLQPLAVTDAVLESSSVAEIDYAAWSPFTTYPLGARVIKASTHRIYESAGAGNVGNDPVVTSGKWLDIGPTNRWAMFDQALGSITEATSSISVSLNAASIGAVALLDVIATDVRVQATGYDRTTAVAGAVTFLDLPAGTTHVTVTVSGSGTISVGTLLIGRVVGLGITEASPSAGITDYSRKDVDDFGAVTIVERAWAKRMTATALIDTASIDSVFARVAGVRARPALWIGQSGLDSLTSYGFFKDFSIEVGETVSKLSLTIEGLSTAGKIEASPFARLAEQIAALASDSILSHGSEKQKAAIDFDALSTERSALATQYASLGSPAGLAASVAGMNAAVAALSTYLSGLFPSWTDADSDTPLDAAVWTAKWNDAYQAVNNARVVILAYADWRAVGGAGKPEDDATRNDDGANMLFAPNDPSQWGFDNGAQVAHLGTGRPLYANCAALQGHYHQIFWSTARVIPVTPGDILWFRHAVTADPYVANDADNVRGGLLAFDSAGAQLSGGIDIGECAVNAGECRGPVVTRYGRVIIPDGVGFVRTYSIRVGGSGGTMYVGEPFLNRFEPAATKGADIASNVTDGGAPLTREQLLTSAGVSAAYAGQAATEAAIFGANQNRLFNSEGKYGSTGWFGQPFSVYSDWIGTFFSAPIGAGGVQVLTSARPVNWAQGQSATLAATFRGDASVNQFLFVDVEWRNGGNGALAGYSSTSINGVYWTNVATAGSRKSQTFTSPYATDGSGFVKAYVRIVTNSDVAVSYGELLVTRIQLEPGAIATLYNAAADDGAVLSNVTGRLASGAAHLPVNYSAGLRVINQSGDPFTQSNAGSSVTVYIAALSLLFDNGAVVNYPSASVPGLAYATSYVFWRVDPNLDGGSSYGVSTLVDNAISTGKVVIGTFRTMANTGTGGGSGGGGFGGGYYCPTTETMILLADEARAGPGRWVRADMVQPWTDWAWTRHEMTGEWGAWPFTHAEHLPNRPVMTALHHPRTTPEHPFRHGDDWTLMREIGRPDGFATVVHFTVDDAHTYIARHPDEPEDRWIVSHNKSVE